MVAWTHKGVAIIGVGNSPREVGHRNSGGGAWDRPWAYCRGGVFTRVTVAGPPALAWHAVPAGNRNEAEQLINRLKLYRAVATPFDNRAYVFQAP